jgi:hypothetical protein
MTTIFDAMRRAGDLPTQAFCVGLRSAPLFDDNDVAGLLAIVGETIWQSMVRYGRPDKAANATLAA